MTSTADDLQSDFLTTMHARGYVHQCTDPIGLDAALTGGVVPAYIGFDCTADSLHVGSLVQIMMLRWLQKTGHKPIVLLGGGTTRIGDPSGRDASRQLLTDADIQHNMDGIRQVFEKFLTFGDGPTDAVMVNNADWLDGLAYIPFLREVGRHFSVNRMLSFDSVKLRLEREQPLTFLEFNYMILQGYDYLELSRRSGCLLQMGGSDQWGNIVNGVELTRRIDQREIYGLTSPLITLANGQKMGKTAQGAIWLNEDRLSAYDYWQFWRNTADADVERFLKLFTELPLDEIAELSKLEGQELNAAKKRLADAATAMAHGEAAAAAAAETARRAFEEGDSADGLPTLSITQAQADAGITVIDLMIEAGMAKSRGEARKLIRGGGVRVADEKVADEALSVSADAFAAGPLKLSVGKKRHVLVHTAD
ncbi:MAG: tyrosine--tRNA ligase [Minwuia sp.]|nr:tyrosine--tRNA ligase [Minwuia sp.]